MDEVTFLAGCAQRLVRVIEAQHAIVDARLTRPARWRGPLRRDIVGRAPDEAQRAAHAATYDWLGTTAMSGRTLDEELLLEARRRLTGDDAYRTRGITIGGHPVGHPRAARVGELTVEALRRAADGGEPPALAAARLHLELALIHPFLDGNGRTARLAASYVLMRAGYRSSLCAAVEQHSCYDPPAYGRSFAHLRARRDDAATWIWLNAALGAMALSSQLVAWRRSQRATPARQSAHLPEDASARAALAFQLRRLRAEERDDARRG